MSRCGFVRNNKSMIKTENDSINYLWNNGSESDWRKALEHYYAILSSGELILDSYIANVDAYQIKNLSVRDFYDFLYDKYFVWKFTAKNRLATTRISLRKYIDENKLEELSKIQAELFSADHNDISKCLQIASQIKGLGIAGASGLLAILFPAHFGTVDKFLVKSLLKIDGVKYRAELARINLDAIKNKEGTLLIKILKEKADELNNKFHTDFWTPRKIDMVLWSVER
ncbi:MAG: hypothetical protein IJE70_05740 [Oscillospiraceae bacterium]|nr:hypothetical protein [Oscillospiraceae bacterium]